MSNLLDDMFPSSEIDGELNIKYNEREEYKKIKERCRTDFGEFARYFLGEYFESEWSSFHYDIIKDLEDITLHKKNIETKTVRSAPRGHAKSTWVTFAYPIWCVCYGYKQTIILISCTASMSKLFLTRIRDELEFNPKIRMVFGEIKGDTKWSTEELVTSNGIYITGKGAGQQMRGLNLKSRPDLIIIDDLEDDEAVATETNREKLMRWFTSAVMKMGSPNCDFFFIGTILSYDALLYKLLNEPRFSSWERRVYRAVITFSKSPLWEEWEKLMTDLSDKDSYHTALNFYEAHKEEMLKGTKVLWEGQRKDMYLYLMTCRLEDEEAFNSELQNDPQTEKTRLFKTEWLDENKYNIPPKIRRVVGAVDPSCGKNRKADTSAIIILGEGEDNYIYVLEASIKVRTPDELIQDMETIIGRYYTKLDAFVVETNQFQAFFSTTVQEHFLNLGIYVNWVEITHAGQDNKHRRIMSMIPKFKNGYIKIKDTQVMLYRQLKNYPKDKDDGVDCLEMALRQILADMGTGLVFGNLSSDKERGEGIVQRIKNAVGF